MDEAALNRRPVHRFCGATQGMSRFSRIERGPQRSRALIKGYQLIVVVTVRTADAV